MRILCIMALAAYSLSAASQEYDGGYAAAQARVRAEQAATGWPDALNAYAASLNQVAPQPQQQRPTTCTTRERRDIYGQAYEVTVCQ